MLAVGVTPYAVPSYTFVTLSAFTVNPVVLTSILKSAGVTVNVQFGYVASSSSLLLLMLRTFSWFPSFSPASVPASLLLTVRPRSVSSPSTCPDMLAFLNVGSAVPYTFDASSAMIVTGRFVISYFFSLVPSQFPCPVIVTVIVLTSLKLLVLQLTT